MSLPLVSVIIPVYNAEKYIRQTVRSVLDQTLHEFELIILNDGSRDSSGEILQQMEKEDQRIHVIQKANTGVSDTRNTGISQARGKYLAFLDADDLWKAENLQKKINCLQTTQKKWVFSNVEMIDENNHLLPQPVTELTTRDILNKLLLWESGDVIPGPCSNIVVEKELFRNGLQFDIHLSSPADRDICIQLAAKAEPAFLNEVLWQYRLHEQSMTSTNRKVAGEVVYYINKLKHSGLYRDQKVKRRSISNLYLMLSGICFKFLRQRMKGINYLAHSFAWSPANVWNKKIKSIFRSK